MAVSPHSSPLAEYPGEAGFWDFLDRLVASSRLVIDRPKGSAHPLYPAFIYPLDYGYLDGSQAMDGAGIDFWLGSLAPPLVSGILCTVDLSKRDAEVKILLGCSQADVDIILAVTNEFSMRALYLPRQGSEEIGARNKK
jgi:inorganic pyrophosphatase